MNFEDKILTCRRCNKQFTFSAGEQSFYAEKGLMNTPNHCPECRAERKQNGGFNSSQSRERAPRNTGEKIQHPVTCASCGKQTTVPFVPKYDRPVYCSECFEQQRVATAARA